MHLKRIKPYCDITIVGHPTMYNNRNHPLAEPGGWQGPCPKPPPPPHKFLKIPLSFMRYYDFFTYDPPNFAEIKTHIF